MHIGCDMSPVSQSTNLRPSECRWLIESGEYPDISDAKRIDLAHYQYIDSSGTWIKARMNSSYRIAQLKKDAINLSAGKYSDFQSFPGGTAKEDAGSRLVFHEKHSVLYGAPRNWPQLSSDTPKWWLPPSNVEDGIVYLWQKQVRVGQPGEANRAVGLYVLYSPKVKTLWIWKWNEQHVRLYKTDHTK
ncbi:MAG: hypothetical protein Tsb009_34800 [Planctomycetaceae bacterium]